MFKSKLFVATGFHIDSDEISYVSFLKGSFEITYSEVRNILISAKT